MPELQSDRTDSSWSRCRVSTVLVSALTIVLATAALGRTAVARTFGAISPQPPMILAVQGTPSDPEPVLVFLTSTGFEQEHFDLRAGTKLVSFRNQSGADNLVFTLAIAGVGSYVSPPIARNTRFDVVVPFFPGQATITEATHTDWICSATVTP